MVALNETLAGVDLLVTGNGGLGAALRSRTLPRVLRDAAPPAMWPTIYVPVRRGETLTHAEVVARKV